MRRKKDLENEKKRMEKDSFIRRFFPDCYNLPGGTQILLKTNLDIIPGRKRGVGKIEECSNQTPAKKLNCIFSNNYKLKVKTAERSGIGLSGGSASLSGAGGWTNHKRGQGPLEGLRDDGC